MNAFMFQKAKESIRQYGFIDPILVRTLGERWQIIDGEHRWQAAKEDGWEQVPVWDLGEVPEAKAKRLTITMNELRGQADPTQLGNLLRDLSDLEPLEDLLQGLPFTPEAFGKLTGLSSVDWEGLSGPLIGDKSVPERENEPDRSGEGKWVERLYRFPPTAAAILDDALAKAKAGDEMPDWQALELICADFLAGG